MDRLTGDRRECPNPNFYVPNESCQNLKHKHVCTLECADGATLLTKSGLRKAVTFRSMETFATCDDQWSIPTVNPIGPSLVDPNTPACVPDWDPSNFKPITPGGDEPRCLLWATAVGCDCGLRMYDPNAIHFVHVPKNAGSTLKSLLNTEYGCAKLLDRKIRLRPPMGSSMSGHKFYLGQGDETSKYFFFVRDPISRFMSAFYYSKRCPLRTGSEEECGLEKMARFEVFQTPNDLVEALCDSVSDTRKEARKVITSQMPIRNGLWYYFSNGFDNKISRSIPDTMANLKKLIADQRILFVGDVGNFKNDYDKLTTVLQFRRGDKYRHATGPESHVNQGESDEDEPQELTP
eukprot:52316_1